MSHMLNAALYYHGLGFSVIPIKGPYGQNSDDVKKPLIKWSRYQEEPATEKDLRTWWEKWPKANIAIVTGKVSGVDVIDCDSEAGRQAAGHLLPDSLVIPTSKTPKGTGR